MKKLEPTEDNSATEEVDTAIRRHRRFLAGVLAVVSPLLIGVSGVALYTQLVSNDSSKTVAQAPAPAGPAANKTNPGVIEPQQQATLQIVPAGHDSQVTTIVLPQDVSTSATPTFNSVNLAKALDLSNGGTGSTSPEGARANLGAAASGVNADITALTGLSRITPDGTLTLGSSSQAYVLQGNTSSVITATSGANTTTLAFATPLANTVLNLPALAEGTYTLCTSSGNCAGAGGGVTTIGGTDGALARFSGPQTLVKSIASENGATFTIAGGGVIQGASGTASLTLGKAGLNKGQLIFTNDVNSNSVTLQSGASTQNLTFTLPTADGSAGSCLSTNGSGALSFHSCSGGVSSLNGVVGSVAIANSSASANTITIDDATTTAKGLASFNSGNFSVVNGAVNTVQNIAVASAPTFSGLTTNGAGGLTVSGSGGLAVSSAAGVSVTGTGNVVLSNAGGLSVTGDNGVAISGTGALTVTASGGIHTNTLDASGNVSGANLNTSGAVTATGNVSGANVNASGNVSGANLNTSGAVTATGNVSGANINASGAVAATGNVSGANLNTSGSVTATGNLSANNGTFMGGALTVGSLSNAGSTIYAGGGGFSSTVSTGTLTANRNINFGDQSGTVCLQNSAACGFAASSGSNSYIQNGTTVQTGNFALQSTSASSIGAVIRGAVGQTADLLQLQSSTGVGIVFRASPAGVIGSGDGAGATNAITLRTGSSTASDTGVLTVSTGNATSGNSGSIVLDVGTASGTKGNITIGTANASGVTIGRVGTFTTFGGNINVNGTGLNSIAGALGLGTATPQTGSLTMANNWWISSVDSLGTGYVNMFKVDTNNEIQVGAALNVDGGIVFPTDGGQLTMSDMGFGTGITAGTKGSYTMRVGTANALTVYGENDGAGNAQNVRVAIGSSIAPSYVLDVGGDINTTANLRTSGTVRVDNAGNATLGTISGSNVTMSGNFLQNGAGTFTTGSGAVSLNGATKIKPGALSTAALDVQNTGGVSMLSVDTTNSRVVVGPSGGNTTGTVLVLGNKTNAGDPTGVEGSMYYNSSTKAFRCYSNGSWKTCGNTLGVANTTVPASNTVVNTTTETNFASNYPMTANECQVGKVYDVTAQGVYSTAAATPNLTFKMKANGTVLATSPAVTTTASASNRTFRVAFKVICDSVGAAGTVEAQGELHVFSAANSAGLFELSNTAPITLDTTAAQTLQLSAQWSAADPNDTVTLRQFVVGVAGP